MKDTREIGFERAVQQAEEFARSQGMDLEVRPDGFYMVPRENEELDVDVDEELPKVDLLCPDTTFFYSNLSDNMGADFIESNHLEDAADLNDVYEEKNTETILEKLLSLFDRGIKNFVVSCFNLKDGDPLNGNLSLKTAVDAFIGATGATVYVLGWFID